jgi:hypothetical protein
MVLAPHHRVMRMSGARRRAIACPSPSAPGSHWGIARAEGVRTVQDGRGRRGRARCAGARWAGVRIAAAGRACGAHLRVGVRVVAPERRDVLVHRGQVLQQGARADGGAIRVGSHQRAIDVQVLAHDQSRPLTLAHDLGEEGLIDRHPKAAPCLGEHGMVGRHLVEVIADEPHEGQIQAPHLALAP